MLIVVLTREKKTSEVVSTKTDLISYLSCLLDGVDKQPEASLNEPPALKPNNKLCENSSVCFLQQPEFSLSRKPNEERREEDKEVFLSTFRPSTIVPSSIKSN